MSCLSYKYLFLKFFQKDLYFLTIEDAEELSKIRKQVLKVNLLKIQ